MIEQGLRLPQISTLTGIKRHTLNARVKTAIEEKDIRRTAGNQIILNPPQVKSLLLSELAQETGKFIYVGNLKGGVGKTTVAYMLISTLANLGLKVCAVDLDVQANLTNQFTNLSTEQPVFYDLIEKKIPISELPMKITEELHIIPSSLRNSLIEKAMTVQQPKHLYKWFNGLCMDYLRNTYDIIIVDTPPSLTTLNSVFCLTLTSRDTVLIPVAPEEFSILGVQMFLEDINEIRNSYDIQEEVQIKLLMNRFFQTQKSNLEILVKMTELYGDKFSEVILRDISKIREMINEKQDISQITKSKEIYEFIQALMVDLNIFRSISDDNETR